MNVPKGPAHLLHQDLLYSVYEPQSKLLKGSYIGDHTRDYYRGH